MRAFIAAVSVVALSLTACGSTPEQQATLSAAGMTLAAVAAQNSTTVAKVVAKGALFCQLGGGGAIIAVATAAGAPASVLGQGSDVVAQACAAFAAVPVAPPADPGAVVVMTARPTALPAVTS